MAQTLYDFHSSVTRASSAQSTGPRAAEVIIGDFTSWELHYLPYGLSH